MYYSSTNSQAVTTPRFTISTRIKQNKVKTNLGLTCIHKVTQIIK